MDPSDFIPWPVQLGVAGGAVSLLVTTLVWLLRSFVKGTLLTKEQSDARSVAEQKAHEAALVAINAAHQLALKALTDSSESRIGDQRNRGDEWKETALLERAGRVQSGKLVSDLVDAIPKLDDYLVANPPKTGDTVSGEVAA